MSSDLNPTVGTVTRDSARHVGYAGPQGIWVDPTYVNDGNPATGATWETGNDGYEEDYLKSDLGAAYVVSAMNVSFANDGARVTDFQYSTDGTTWFSIPGVETGARQTLLGATLTFTTPITARYWALKGSTGGFHPTSVLNRWEIIGDAAPGVVAAFSGTPLTGVAPLAVQFTDASTGTPTLPDVWHWDFGDGSATYEQNPLHIYRLPGSYTVTLVVTRTSDSATDTETKVAYVVVTDAALGEWIAHRVNSADCLEMLLDPFDYGPADEDDDTGGGGGGDGGGGITMSLHLSITDKDRNSAGVIAPGNSIGLIEDGDWHWFSIRDHRDGIVKRAINNLANGTYLVHVALLGGVLTLGTKNIDVNLVRYHLTPDGNIDQGEVGDLFHDSTAWSDIDTDRRNTDRWFGTFIGKIVVNTTSVDPTEAHAVGIDYRVGDGSYDRTQLIMKFLRQRD